MREQLGRFFNYQNIKGNEMIKFLKEEWFLLLVIALVSAMEYSKYQDKKECAKQYGNECVKMLVPIDKTGETAAVIYYGKD